MKKFFSLKAFLLSTLIHLLVTWLLWYASEYSYSYWKQTGFRDDSTWSTVLHGFWLIGWVVQPVMMFAQYHPFPGDHAGNAAFDRVSPTVYLLPWIVFFAICVGLIAPRVSRWEQRSKI